MLFNLLRQMSSASVLGMNRRNLELVTPRNPRKYFPVADDKLLSKKVLSQAGVPVAPTLAVFESFLDVADLTAKISGLDEFVVKPARGSGGRGILVISEKQGDAFITPSGHRISRDELARHVADIVFGVYALDKADTAIVEPRLKPTGLFAKLYPEGLSDIRLILVDDTFVICMLRIPTRGSDGRANLHQGAIGIGVDRKTGETYRAWHRGKEIKIHPETGVGLLGRRVDGWEGIVSVAEKTARTLPLKFLGVDMVVDRDLGPLVLEVNARPGIEIQNVTGVSLLTDLRQRKLLRPA